MCTCHLRHTAFSRLRSLNISFYMCIYIIWVVLLSFRLISCLIFQFLLQRLELAFNRIFQQGISRFHRKGLLWILNYVFLHELIHFHSVAISEKLIHAIGRIILRLFVLRKNFDVKISDTQRILGLSKIHIQQFAHFDSCLFELIIVWFRQQFELLAWACGTVFLH